MTNAYRPSLPAALSSTAAFALLAATLHAQAAGALEFVPEAQLTGSGTAQFGATLSLSGDDLLVRGPGSSPSIPARQFVFHRSAGSWSQQAAFDVPSTPFVLNCVGRSTDLAIAGDLLVIGQPYNGSVGRAWISQRTGSSWSSPVYIENQDYFDFGQAVLLYGGSVFVGMPDDPFAGAVGIWRKNLSGWNETAFIQSPPPHPGEMGSLLASSGTTLLAAERDEVKVFVQGATLLAWNYQALLDPPGNAVVRAMAIDQDVAVLSTEALASCSTSTPAVLVYERSGTTWSQTAQLAAADSAAPELGSSLAVHGDTIYVGAATQAPAGAVYVFQHVGGTWTQTAKLLPDPVLGSGARFGSALAGDGLTLCVGAPGTGVNPGTVQVFDVGALPPPQVYCTAKVNSLGCTPQMASNGISSATNPNPFVLGATNVINVKTGLLLYTTVGPALTPFQGGTLCIAQPLHRTPAQSSGGNALPANDCSGAYTFDFNAWLQAGHDPSIGPGSTVWAQYYSRDPADAFGVGLTDAVRFDVGN